MGHIKKVLALKELEPLEVTPNYMATELCEDVHIHYRNYRLDLSVRELKTLLGFLHRVFPAMEKQIESTGYKEGNPEFFLQFKETRVVEEESDYYPRRLCIELQTNNRVHLHYREFRLDLHLNEFLEIAEAFAQAHKAYKEFAGTPRMRLSEGLHTVPLDRIQPYDDGHRPGAIDEEHRKGIEGIKKRLLNGEKIDPILIRPNGLRLQGFKRYMAYKELGYGEIECQVDAEANWGDQAEQEGILAFG